VQAKSFWHYRELKIDCWTSRQILCEKNIKFFFVWKNRILVEMWNVNDGHIFPRSLLHTCRLETNSLCINTPLIVNKNFQILIIFIEINVNDFLLCADHVTTSIILHTRRPNCQWKVCYALVYYVSANFFFHILGSWILRFSHRFISPHEVCTNAFQVLGGQ